MASAAGVAGVRATLDLGSKSSKCVQCGEARFRADHAPTGKLGTAVKLTGNTQTAECQAGKTRRSCDADLWGTNWSREGLHQRDSASVMVSSLEKINGFIRDTVTPTGAPG